MLKQSIMLGLVLSLIFTPVSAQTYPGPVDPPVAKKIAKIDTVHGDIRIDNYYWMREKTNPEVVAYLEAENAYTEKMTGETKELQEMIYQEILRRTKQTDLSVPYRLGSYWYYIRTVEGKQYPIYCRKKESLDSLEQITINMNELAQGHKFAGLGLYQISDDGNFLAYSLDSTGFRQYQLAIKDLRTGQNLADQIGQVNSAEWAADNKTLFYVKEDYAKRPYRLYRHVFGSKKDDLLYEETDELYRIGVYRSRDKKMLFLSSQSSITSEVRYLSSDRPTETFNLLLSREVGHEYSPDHREGVFYIRTNKDAKNYRLVTVAVNDPQPKNWKELLPHRPAVKLEGFELFKNHVVFNERENGLTRLVVYDFRTGKSQNIAFPEPVYSAFPSNNPEYNVTTFRFSYQSFITPSSVFDYDMDTGKRTLLKQVEVLGGYDPTQYTSERISARAPDGTMIPISLVYRNGKQRNGSSPLLLYGYGSYGASMPVTFSVSRLSLLDRGVIYALAHIRGGGDMGEVWHDQGKMMTKRNTFTDFIACAEHLIQEKFTSADRLAIQGGSAGGLLIGAVLNMRPDLFKVAHLAVPFVDVINTMLDATLPLTVGEYLEWGNPKKKDEYEYLKTYCPYTNIEAKAYPAIIVTTSFNDSQVMYWEPAKYTAKMRATKKDKNPLVLKVNMGAGHGGASGRYDAFREQAFVYAFLLGQVGINK